MSVQNLVALFRSTCERFDRQNAFLVKHDGAYVGVSHRTAMQRVDNLAMALLELGLAPGDKVAILSETRLEWALADLAILATGAANVPVYPNLPPQRIAAQLAQTEVCGLFVSTPALLAGLLTLRDQMPGVRFIALMDPDPETPHISSMASLEARGANSNNRALLERRIAEVDREQLATLVFTSGTTGNPMAAMLTHGNLLANLEGFAHHLPVGLGDLTLAHLPLSHMFERMVGHYCMMYLGVTIAYAESVTTVAADMRLACPTVLVSVPRFFEKMQAGICAGADSAPTPKRLLFRLAQRIGHKALPWLERNQKPRGLTGLSWLLAERLVFRKVWAALGGRLRFAVSGGATLPVELGAFFQGMGLTVAEGYGLTETAPVLTINRPDWRKPGTVGRAIDNVTIKIAEDGEILVRGANIMLGYYRDPQATAAALIDGWFHTGDIGALDNTGFLRLTDRKKDLIVTSKGKNVAPLPLEQALTRSPLIEQAVVLGDSRNYVAALLVPPWHSVAVWAPRRGWPTEPERLCTHPEFLAAMNTEVQMQMTNFAQFERVKRFAILPRPLSDAHEELTPSHKLRRRQVLLNWADQVESLYR